MVAHGRGVAARRLGPGDGLVYYAPREGIGEGTEIRAFVAIGRVLDAPAAERVMAEGVSGWYRRMAWLASRPADVYPLLDNLSFVRDRRHWGMYFRRSLFEVEARDFTLIRNAMAATWPTEDPLQQR